MAATTQILERVYDHEVRRATQVFLTQPLGGGAVADYTWAQVLDEARRMAAHLRTRGIGPGSHVALLSKNCAHFLIAELAIWLAGGSTVAIFPTEGAQTIRYVLEHSDARLLFVGKLDLWEQQRAGVPEGLPCMALPLAPPGTLPRWQDVVAATPPLAGRPARGDDDLAMLIYTSGSTGTPKGAMIDFRAVSAVAEGYTRHIRAQSGIDGAWRVLSYLPLAHSFERAVIASVALHDGQGHLYFAETLDTFLQDLRRARPTLFISVPRLWLKFQQGVFTKMPPAKLDRLLGLPLIGRLVGRKVLAGLGLDQVRLAASGSAPIPPELIQWYRRLGLRLMEGYGMTEDFTFSHSSTHTHHAPGCVGVPYPGVQARISEAGEVEIRSPGRMRGYYKRPDLDAECFTADGFFRTGDRGSYTSEGLLRLTGRVKELFKTAKGKYVAPAPIENLLNEHPMVELSMVSGVGRPAAYAIVVLAEALRPRLGEAALRTEVQAEMSGLLARVNRSVADYERLQMLVIAREPWTIENGCLTPTMKIRRAAIEGACEATLDTWYAAPPGVVWG